MIPLREQEYIRERFARELAGKVKIDFFTQNASAIFVPGREECATCDDAGKPIQQVAARSPLPLFTAHAFASELAAAAPLGVGWTVHSCVQVGPHGPESACHRASSQRRVGVEHLPVAREAMIVAVSSKDAPGLLGGHQFHSGQNVVGHQRTTFGVAVACPLGGYALDVVSLGKIHFNAPSIKDSRRTRRTKQCTDDGRKGQSSVLPNPRTATPRFGAD